MKYLPLIVAIIVLHGEFFKASGLSDYLFPDKVKFGGASSAYQIEGAWNEDGKGPSLWDNITHAFPSVIADGKNGDIACDSYHKYNEDVQLASDLGHDFYKFSISWPRILPDGTVGNINQQGVDYYDDLIDLIIENGMEPHVVMFNFDIPWELERYGGFTNESTVQHFANYAELLFQIYGNRVQHWITVNEAHAFCKIIPDDILSRVLTQDLGFKEYQCGHNLIKAHAAAYRVYESSYKSKQQGQISMAFSMYWYYPETNSDADRKAAERARAFVFEWFAHPIVKGNYPQALIDQIGNLSQQEGRTSSRLPTFTDDEIEYIQGTYDFIGLNAFRTYNARDISSTTNLPLSLQNDMRVQEVTNSSFDTSSVYVTLPQGFRDAINFASDYCNGCDIFFTEHGFGSRDATLNDTARLTYMQKYMDQILLAIHEDGVSVTGYAVWHFMDSFYFNAGETLKFGLINVDFNSSNTTRTPRRSAAYLKNIIETRSLTQFEF